MTRPPLPNVVCKIAETRFLKVQKLHTWLAMPQSPEAVREIC